MIDGTLLRLTVRQYLGVHRLGLLIFLLVLTALPLIVAASFYSVARWDPQLPLAAPDFARRLFSGFQLPLLYPVITLILTATAAREEIQNGTISYLWLKPLPRTSIVASKFLGAFSIALALSVSSLAASLLVLSDAWSLFPEQAVALGVALFAYGALFFLLGTLFDRGLIWGFVYLLAWEESFSRVSPAASQLSIRHYAESLQQGLLGGRVELSPETSLAVLLALGVAFLILSGWRFSRLEFAGEGEARR